MPAGPTPERSPSGPEHLGEPKPFAPPLLPSTREEKQWGMFAHLSALPAMALSTMGFLGPLIIFLVKKDQSKYVEYHAKEALNFQLAVLIAFIIAGIIAIATCGWGVPLPIIVGVYAIVMSIIAGLKANEGVMFQYPWTYRFIK